MKNIRYLELDFYRTSYHSVKAHQYDKDTRFIEVTCINDAAVYPLDPETMTCDLKLVTPDKRHMFKQEAIQENGTVLITLEESMLLAAGVCKAELNIYDADSHKLLSTMPFDLIVIGSVYDNSIIEESDEFSVLNDMIFYNKELGDRLEQLESDVEGAEAVRENNESIRSGNEASRVLAEESRAAEEKMRAADENTRKSNESDRQAAEAERVKNENTRLSDESERKADEREREKNESVRIQNEANRELAEGIREQNEIDRTAAEAGRKNDFKIMQDINAIELEKMKESGSASEIAAAAYAADAKTSREAAKSSETNAKISETNSKTSETNAKASEANSKVSEANAKASEEESKKAQQAAEAAKGLAEDFAAKAESYARGGTGSRENEDTDNGLYYYEQVKHLTERVSNALVPMGTITSEQLLNLVNPEPGDMYNISDEFVTTDAFEEGAGIVVPVGANVYWTNNGKWDVQAGTTVSGVKGSQEDVYRKGNVSISTSDIGAIGAKKDGSFYGLTNPDGDDLLSLRTPKEGLLPHMSTIDGFGNIGMPGWSFEGMYAKTFFGDLSGGFIPQVIQPWQSEDSIIKPGFYYAFSTQYSINDVIYNAPPYSLLVTFAGEFINQLKISSTKLNNGQVSAAIDIRSGQRTEDNTIEWSEWKNMPYQDEVFPGVRVVEYDASDISYTTMFCRLGITYCPDYENFFRDVPPNTEGGPKDDYLYQGTLIGFGNFFYIWMLASAPRSSSELIINDDDSTNKISVKFYMTVGPHGDWCELPNADDVILKDSDEGRWIAEAMNQNVADGLQVNGYDSAWRIYVTPGSLGLADNKPTLKEILDAMPDCSEYIRYGAQLADSDYPDDIDSGTFINLHIWKFTQWGMQIVLTGFNDASYMYYWAGNKDRDPVLKKVNGTGRDSGILDVERGTDRYWGLKISDSTVSDYLRVTKHGILPDEKGGNTTSCVGTDLWPFDEMHSNKMFGKSVSSGSVGKNGYIAYPTDGVKHFHVSSTTGYLCIRLPIQSKTFMCIFTVDIYNYEENSSVRYIIGGHIDPNSSTTTWYRTTAIAIGANPYAPLANLPVYFGQSSGYPWIRIGHSDTIWKWPIISIHDITIEYANSDLGTWQTGWVIDITPAPAITFPSNYAVTTPNCAYKAATSTAVLDSGDNRWLKLAYSKAGITSSDTSWLCAWYVSGNDVEIRAISPLELRKRLNAAGLASDGTYYGLTAPDGNATNWIRTPSYGILPYERGVPGSGHSYIGASEWYFASAYIDNIYGTNFYGYSAGVTGTYSGNGGAQPPSFINSGKVKFAMMNKLMGLSAFTSSSGYADCLLMDTYTGGDVPYTTALCLGKGTTPVGWIAVGSKNSTTGWTAMAQLITSSNIASQTVAAATKATQDGNGATIANTYLKLSGGTMTGSITMSSSNQSINWASGMLIGAITSAKQFAFCPDGWSTTEALGSALYIGYYSSSGDYKISPRSGGKSWLISGFTDISGTNITCKDFRTFTNGMYISSGGYTNTLSLYTKYYSSSATHENSSSVQFVTYAATGNAYFRPELDNDVILGASGKRWKQIYAATSSISTSDERKKINIKSLDEELTKDFIMGLNPISYIMADGDSGRTHYGMGSQSVEQLMHDLGMTSKDFAGFIKSPKTREVEVEEEVDVEKDVEVADEDGTVHTEKQTVKEIQKRVEHEIIEGEYDYGLRYEEFIAPTIKFTQILYAKIGEQQEQIDRLEAENRELKDRLARIEEMLGLG